MMYTPYNNDLPDSAQGPDCEFVTTLEFIYTSPPLAANQRMHWAEKMRVTKQVRQLTEVMAHRIPDLGKCRVSLTWFVNTRHRRDADNIVPTLKAMCDGLVDAGVVADDIPELMEKVMPVIQYEKGCEARMELRIEKLQ